MSQPTERHIEFVNVSMKEINDLSDNLYESLMDNECESTLTTIDVFIEALWEIRISQQK